MSDRASWPAPSDLLERLERYYDLAPRAAATTEEIGPFTLFLATGGWDYYARPRLCEPTGTPAVVTERDVRTVLDRQRELGVPLSLEWVHQTSPTVYAAALAAGMRVERCPLLVLDKLVEPRPSRFAAAQLRLLAADNPDLAAVVAAISIGFDHEGTATGDASVAQRDEVVAAGVRHLDGVRTLMAQGATVQYGCFLPDQGAVGGGAHNPRGEVTEIVGVGVLPAFRRGGLAAAVTHELCRDAHARGASTVFCSAAGADVARIYHDVGFRHVGTACIADAQG